MNKPVDSELSVAFVLLLEVSDEDSPFLLKKISIKIDCKLNYNFTLKELATVSTIVLLAWEITLKGKFTENFNKAFVNN